MQVHDDNAGLSVTDLLELNRDLQGSRPIRLLATLSLGLYATLIERHLSDGAVPRLTFTEPITTLAGAST
jgi:hypothetical protein